MSTESLEQTELKIAFDREIKALICVLAEICVHEFLTLTHEETEDVKEK